MYEPIGWTEVWYKDVNKKSGKAKKEPAQEKGNEEGGSDDEEAKDFGGGGDFGLCQMSIVTSALSKKKCLFAIGSTSGRIKIYDVVTKS